MLASWTTWRQAKFGVMNYSCIQGKSITTSTELTIRNYTSYMLGPQRMCWIQTDELLSCHDSRCFIFEVNHRGHLASWTPLNHTAGPRILLFLFQGFYLEWYQSNFTNKPIYQQAYHNIYQCMSYTNACHIPMLQYRLSLGNLIQLCSWTWVWNVGTNFNLEISWSLLSQVFIGALATLAIEGYLYSRFYDGLRSLYFWI